LDVGVYLVGYNVEGRPYAVTEVISDLEEGRG
jgi:hypothetical protein